MDRQVSPVTRLAAVALLVGIAVIGCAKHEGAVVPAGSMSAVQSSGVNEAAATPAESAAPTDSASPSPSSEASPTAAAAATPDPLDGLFSNLNNLINGVNSSLSGGAGTSGGE